MPLSPFYLGLCVLLLIAYFSGDFVNVVYNFPLEILVLAPPVSLLTLSSAGGGELLSILFDNQCAFVHCRSLFWIHCFFLFERMCALS